VTFLRLNKDFGAWGFLSNRSSTQSVTDRSHRPLAGGWAYAPARGLKAYGYTPKPQSMPLTSPITGCARTEHLCKPEIDFGGWDVYADFMKEGKQVKSIMSVTVNLQESPGKTVGRRRVLSAWEQGMSLQQAGQTYHEQWGKGLRKGVYRYHSHEEADLAWLLARTGS
jgi:hypothetical protein